MTAEKFKRKLTAILSADVKGYSRLMGTDEEATVRTLQEYREVMASSIQHHRGLILDTAGDSLLAEFASVVDAVQCAVEIQQVLRAKNALLPEARQMEFRIGINLGDVIEEGDTIYGDGVNIAARVQSLAEAGGICVSESAYQQIENKLPLRYDYLGEHEVKNIAKPVRVYRARIESEAAPSQLGNEKKPAGKKLSKVALAIIAIVVIAGLVALYQFVLRPSLSKGEVASREKMAFPLPDKPSIAVLPFVNMSGDPKQEFFCDGITEDIITALSKVPKLFVIARNSTFVYKGKPVKIQKVAEDLGVQYVLEGSVQRSGDRLRITAQLIDALTGNHLWAERYDRDLKDLFALQDEVTIRILSGLSVNLTEGETARLRGRPPQNLDCYLKIMEARDYVFRGNIESNKVARRLAEEVIALCPKSAPAYFYLSVTHEQDYLQGSTKSPKESLEKAIELARKALALADRSASFHGYLGILYMRKGEYDKAIAEAERGVALDPSGADVRRQYGNVLLNAGRLEEAIPLLQEAIRLNPLGPPPYFTTLGSALRITGRLEEAVSLYKQVLRRMPDHVSAHTELAATYVMLGREQEARAEAAEVLRINPKFSLENYAKTRPIKDQTVTDKVVDALRKAGLK